MIFRMHTPIGLRLEQVVGNRVQRHWLRFQTTDHSSNTIEELGNVSFDTIITVCDHANEVCPILPGNQTKIHYNFADPSKQNGSANELIKAFRDTRDQIKEFCQNIDVLN